MKLSKAFFTTHPHFSNAARASPSSAPVNVCTIRTARSRSFSFFGSKSTAALAFTKTYGAKFPIGNAQYYREPYSDITLPPAFMVVDETGRIVSFHFGLASLPAAIRAAEGKP